MGNIGQNPLKQRIEPVEFYFTMNALVTKILHKGEATTFSSSSVLKEKDELYLVLCKEICGCRPSGEDSMQWILNREECSSAVLRKRPNQGGFKTPN